MAKSRSLLIIIALIAAGALLLFFGPKLAHHWGKNFDQAPPVEPSIGKVKVEDGKASRRAFRTRIFEPLTGESEIRHLDTVQIQNRGLAVFSLQKFSLRLSGPALAVIERWTPSDANGPVLIHLISGQLDQLSAGTAGKLYVLRGGEMTDPKGASLQRTRALRVSAVSLGEPPSQPVMAVPSEPTTGSLVVAPPEESDPGSTSLTNDYLDGQIAKEADQFQRCQSNSLRDQGEVRGQILMGLTINTEGKVAETQILNSTFQDDKLHNCLVQVFKRIQFKPFKGSPIVRSYPLNFE